MGEWTIIYLSGCIVSLGYGMLVTGRLNFKEFMVLFTLSAFSWLSFFALFLGHGFNISNKNEREELFPINIHGIPLKPMGEKKNLPGLRTHLDTTHYDLADSRKVIAGRVFTALNLYVIDDYMLLQYIPISECKTISELSSIETPYEITNPDPLRSILFEIEYNLNASQQGTQKMNCKVLLREPGCPTDKPQLLLQIQGERSGIVFFDCIHSSVEIEELIPDHYTIRLIDLKTGNCLFEKKEYIVIKKALTENFISATHGTDKNSEIAKARIIVSSHNQNKTALDDCSESSYLHHIFEKNEQILSAVK